MEPGNKDDHGDPEHQGGRPIPKRVQITKEVVTRFGPTMDCRKCRGVMANDRSYQHVHHSETCRIRMEKLMSEHEDFREQLERAETRRTQRMADILEQRDRARREQDERDRKRARALQEQGPGSSNQGGLL